MSDRNLVLLGIGHTNAHIVKQWETNPIPGCKLTCISKFPTATYSGMLPGTLGLQFDDDEMRIDLADLCQRSGAELILADTNGIDLGAGRLHFEDHESIPFDALSIGVGSMPAGWEDHKDARSLVPIKPMQTFLERLEGALQRDGVAEVAKTFGHHADNPKLLASSATKKGASKLLASSATKKGALKLLASSVTKKVAIVGGGVASVEIALCLKQQCEKRNIACEFSIEIFTSSDAVAEGMTPRSVDRIEQILKSRGIHITPGHRVTDVGDDFITTEDGCRHEADVVIWATGAAAPPVLGKLGLQTDDRGFIATTKTLQSLSDPRIFAVGDSGTILESPCPKAGVYAVRQCPILWHNLREFFDLGSMKTFEPQSDFLKLLNTGDGKALLQYGMLTTHARWCWHLKTWIDKRFISEFQDDHLPRSQEAAR